MRVIGASALLTALVASLACGSGKDDKAELREAGRRIAGGIHGAIQVSNKTDSICDNPTIVTYVR